MTKSLDSTSHSRLPKLKFIHVRRPPRVCHNVTNIDNIHYLKKCVFSDGVIPKLSKNVVSLSNRAMLIN